MQLLPRALSHRPLTDHIALIETSWAQLHSGHGGHGDVSKDRPADGLEVLYRLSINVEIGRSLTARMETVKENESNFNEKYNGGE